MLLTVHFMKIQKWRQEGQKEEKTKRKHNEGLPMTENKSDMEEVNNEALVLFYSSMNQTHTTLTQVSVVSQKCSIKE